MNPETPQVSWKTKTMLTGAILGALVGVGAAYLLIARAEREDETIKMSAGEGVRLGLLVLGLLRQVSLLGDSEK